MSAPTYVLVQPADLDALHQRIEALTEQLKLIRQPTSEDWLDTFQLMKFLGISKRTAQNYRDQGLIPFSQIGRKILYRRKDVEAFLMSRYQKPFHQR